MNKSYQKNQVLVIKFGGLGDFFLSINPFFSIREHHLDDCLILVTEKKYLDIANRCGLFDKVILIERSLFYFVDKLFLRKQLVLSKVKKVYDLQTSRRSNSYFKMFKKYKTHWSGIAKGCSHFHNNKDRDNLHTVERFEDQLKISGVKCVNKSKNSWIYEKVSKKDIPKKFAILVPGGSLKRKYKRIPLKTYISVTKILIEKNIIPFIVGSSDERILCNYICDLIPKTINCCNTYNIFQLAYLAKKAEMIIGNDTGLMHLFGMMGKNVCVLFTKFSDPKICAPRGKNVMIYKKNYLQEIINQLRGR